jgi:hypothetical protein
MYLSQWYVEVLKRDLYLKKISVHFSKTTNYVCSRGEIQQTTYFFSTNRPISLCVSATKDKNTIPMNPISNHNKPSRLF